MFGALINYDEEARRLYLKVNVIKMYFVLKGLHELLNIGFSFVFSVFLENEMDPYEEI